jgi:hypothetical protein
MNKQVIGILLFLSSVGVLLYGIIVYTTRANTTPVSLLISPDKAEIAFDNQKVTGSQVVHMKPGVYDFKASRNGFEDKTIRVEVKQGSPLKLVFALRPLTNEATKEAQSSSKISEIDKTTTDRLASEQQELEKANPVIKKLPIKNLIYSIGYKMDPSRTNSVIVEIDAPEGYRNAAINKIKEQGFDPATINITFRNYANTFTE